MTNEEVEMYGDIYLTTAPFLWVSDKRNTRFPAKGRGWVDVNPCQAYETGRKVRWAEKQPKDFSTITFKQFLELYNLQIGEVK